FFSSRRRHTRWPRDWSSDVCSSDLNYLGKLHRGTVWRGECEVTARLRLYRTENIGCATALVFTVPPRFSSRSGWRSRPDFGVQRDWLLIQTQNWFVGIVGFLIRRQNILHLRDIVFIQFGHAPHFFSATA